MDNYKKFFREFSDFYFIESYKEYFRRKCQELSRKDKIKLIKSRQEFMELPQCIQIMIIKSIKNRM